jgi:solute carrier family 35 protein F5
LFPTHYILTVLLLLGACASEEKKNPIDFESHKKMTAKTASYSLGLFFIFLVAVIWSVSSVVVQYLYTDQHFDSPFLITYIGTSLFILLLPSRLLWERRHQCGVEEADKIPWRTGEHNAYQQIDTSESVSSVQIDANVNINASSIQIWSHEQHAKVALKIAPVWFVANWAYNASLAYTSITSSTVLASTGSLFTFLFAVLYGDEAFTLFKFMGVAMGVTGSILTGLHDASFSLDDMDTNATTAMTNATLTNSLLRTASSHAGMPSHISQQDPWDGHAMWGDALGLLSAVGYGAYAVMIRIWCPHDERKMSMQLLLGYIGLFNASCLLPICIYVLLLPSSSHASASGDDDDATTGTTVQQGTLTWLIFGYLVADGFFDNVLSDYLWARAVVLTSATVATVGLGLTIPLAFASDWVMGHANVLSVQSAVGALAVLAGFILVNIGTKEEEIENDDDDGGHDDEIVAEVVLV